MSCLPKLQRTGMRLAKRNVQSDGAVLTLKAPSRAQCVTHELYLSLLFVAVSGLEGSVLITLPGAEVFELEQYLSEPSQLIDELVPAIIDKGLIVGALLCEKSLAINSRAPKPKKTSVFADAGY